MVLRKEPKDGWATQWAVRWLRILVHAGALLPLAALLWDYTQDQLSVNPIREITRRTGRYALVLLILSLACTPIRIALGKVFSLPLVRLRRSLGLYAFFYASLHLLAFAGLDYGFNAALIVEEIPGKRFMQVGLLAFLILLSLTITSTRGWVKRLGKNWKRLHRLVYLAALLVIAHFVWVVKGDIRRPLLYGGVIAVLLVARIPGARNTLRKLRSTLRRKPRHNIHSKHDNHNASVA